MTKINISHIDQEKENPFSKITSNLNKAYSVGIIINNDKERYEERIISLQKKIDNLSKITSYQSVCTQTVKLVTEYSKIINSELMTNTNFDKYSFKHEITGISVFEIAYNGIEQIEAVLDNLSHIHIGSITKSLLTLSIKRFFEERKQHEASIEEVKKVACINLYKHRGDNVKNNIIIGKPIPQKYYKEIDLDFKFSTKENNHHKPLNFIYQFIEILNQLEGVEVSLEDISIGSIKVNMKIKLKDKEAEKRVQELLEESKQAALQKSNNQNKLNIDLKNDEDVINRQKKHLEEKINSNISIHEAYLMTLKIQQAEEDLKEKRMKNKLLELKYLKESSDTFVDLLANGYLSQGDFDMLINQITFLTKKDGQIMVGTPINDAKNNKI